MIFKLPSIVESDLCEISNEKTWLHSVLEQIGQQVRIVFIRQHHNPFKHKIINHVCE